MLLIRLLFLSAVCLPAQAITNIEERRSETDREGFYGRAEVGLDAQAGNNDKRKWSAGLSGNWQGEQHRFFMWGNRLYETSNGQTVDDDTFFHSRLVLNYRERWAEEVFVQYERDPFAALAFRGLTGAGVRHHWRLQNGVRWFQGGGLFHEWVRENEPDGERSDHLTRVNLYTHLQWQTDTLKLQTTLYFQPVIDDPDDQRALWQFAISVPVGSHADLKWQWQTRFDTRPPTGTEREHHQTQVRLGINF